MNEHRFATFAVSMLVITGSLFLWIAIEQVRYPGFLEAMEGDILQHVERAAKGEAVYSPASAEYIPLAYMPAYYFASAPLYRLLGDSLTGPRIVSVICSIGTAVVLAWLAWKQTPQAWTPTMTAALFFAGVRTKDGDLTVALPDAMLLFWVILGWAILIHSKDYWHECLWLACFTLAFWTKQHGAIYFAWAALYAAFVRPDPVFPTEKSKTSSARKLPGWLIIVALLILGPGTYFLGEQILGSHFKFYTLDLPSGWERSYRHSLQRLIFVATLYVPFAILLALIYARSLGSWKARLQDPFCWMTWTSLLTCVYTVAATGSANNHYIVAFAMLDLLVVLGATKLIRHGPPRHLLYWLAAAGMSSLLVCSAATVLSEGHVLPSFVPFVAALVTFVWWFAKSVPRWATGSVAALLLILGHVGTSVYWPADYLPDSKFARALEDFRNELKQLDGQVLWIAFGNVPGHLTKTKLLTAPSWVALEDMERTRTRTAGEQLINLERLRGKYLLSDDPIENVPAWSRFAKDVTLVRDFGGRFAGVCLASVHWYGNRSFPRFLYLVPRIGPDS